MTASSKHYWRGFLPLLISNVLITLLSMITSVGTPYITDSFGLTSQQAPWITTLTSMSSAILAPLLGWLGDKRGVKTQFLVGIAFTFIANILCAVTHSFVVFCAGRFLSGIGLAASYPACMSYIADNFPTEKKVGGFSILGACITLGSGLGPTIIGLFLSVFTWRQLFWYSQILVIGMLVYVLLAVKGGAPEGGQARKLDGVGMTMLFLGIGALISLLSLSTQLGWGHPLILALLAVSAVFLPLFFRHEARTAHPMLDAALLKSRRFLIPALTGLYIYGIKCYYSTALPYYFTSGLGMSSATSGFMLTILFLAAFPLSFFVNRLNRRFTTRTLAMCGAATWVLGMLMLVIVTETTPLWYYVLAMILPSLGIALLGGMPNACALKGVPPEKSGAASGAISLLSNLGACLISALVVPYLSVFGAAPDGTPDYVAAFPQVAWIMVLLLAVCFILTIFFPRDKAVSPQLDSQGESGRDTPCKSRC